MLGVSDPQFPRMIGAVFEDLITPRHQTDKLISGDEIFPAMLDVIAEARDRVNSSPTGQATSPSNLPRHFAEKAAEAVEVRVLLDRAGSISLDQSLIDKMEAQGRKDPPLSSPQVVLA